MAMQITAMGRKAYMNDYEKANFDALAQNAARDQQAREFAARAAQDAMRWEADYGKDLDILGRNQQFTLDRDIANRDFTRERDAAQQAFQTEFRDTSLPYQQWNSGGREAWEAELEDANKARDLARTTQDRITAVTQAPTWSMFNPSQQADLIADIQAAMGDVGAIQGRAERSEKRAKADEERAIFMEDRTRDTQVKNLELLNRRADRMYRQAADIAEANPGEAARLKNEADKLMAQAGSLMAALGLGGVTQEEPVPNPLPTAKAIVKDAKDKAQLVELNQYQPMKEIPGYIQLADAYAKSTNSKQKMEILKEAIKLFADGLKDLGMQEKYNADAIRNKVIQDFEGVESLMREGSDVFGNPIYQGSAGSLTPTQQFIEGRRGDLPEERRLPAWLTQGR